MKLGSHATPPTQREIGVAFFALDFEDYFFQQCTQKFLSIAISCGRRSPDQSQIGTESLNSLQFFLR
jgi:hypothetical protein